MASPVADSPTVFGGTVATPPITDADMEPFADPDETLQQSIRSLQQARLSLDAAAQDADASLPSPRLSPKLGATRPAGDVDDDDDVDEFDQDSGPASAHSSFVEAVVSQLTAGDEDGDHCESQETSTAVILKPRAHVARPSGAGADADMTRVLDPRAILDSFDAMPTDMQTLMMYQLLRRCPRKTLRVVADVVNPSLQCDFLKQLPLELSYAVLSYLDHRDLCRAAQVSKHWRHLIDTNEMGWKDLFDRDELRLPPGELDRAIKQGWGWQDPAGAMGCEVDLSAQKRLNSTEAELTKVAVKTEQGQNFPRLRSSKRKRALNSMPGSERARKRSAAHEAKDGSASLAELKRHKSEGPLSAANAAAMAVPDPQIGLPSLRRLHLFKSLYRRHYMIRESWTSGKAPPSHVAFTAHPRNVITCLQFDEDKIITGSDDTLIHIYDTQTGKLRKKLEGHEGGVWALQYEGNVLVSGSTDRSVRVWDIERGLCTQVFYGHTSTVRCLQILMPSMVPREHGGPPEMLPTKPLIITGSRDNQLRVWRLPEAGSRRYIQTGPPANDNDCPYFIRTLVGHSHSVRAIAAHGDTLVSGSYDSSVRVWRISTGEARHVLQGHTQKVYSVVLDHERNRCISGAMDSLVKIWDLDTGACLYNLEGHSLLVGILGLRDERLVSAAADSTLRIWDPENGKCKNVLTAHTGAITCFQHDGQKVISGSEKTVKMWDIATGNCIQDLLTDLSGVWQVKFDDRRCVAAVQRHQITYIEVRSPLPSSLRLLVSLFFDANPECPQILDFGAVRDGRPPEELGKRILLDEAEVRRLEEEEV
jgi:F-box and WD-40 domain protein CDC4